MGKFYQFIGMPNGYSDTIRILTKFLKPAFGVLRPEGSLSVIFFDDTYFHGDTEHEV